MIKKNRLFYNCPCLWPITNTGMGGFIFWIFYRFSANFPHVISRLKISPDGLDSAAGLIPRQAEEVKMEKLVIEGGHRLNGKIRVSGSKNAALPILFAALLADDEVKLSNIPNLRDINTTLQLLATLGAETKQKDKKAKIISRNLLPEAPYDLVRTMRAGILCMGPLLAKLGEARVSLPGGCAIGARPIDQHLKALEKLGAQFSLSEGNIRGYCKRLRGNRVTFDMPTVGGTENLLMAASLAEGETIIENAAREPEVVDLANFLIACGAEIEGHGESVIHIQGKDRLDGARYAVMPDRIEAGTFMVAAAITGGRLELENCPSECLSAVMEKLSGMGLRFSVSGDSLIVESGESTNCVNIKTSPYPGFPTDMQAQVMALAAVSKGMAAIEESIFENRFMHVQELSRMGAKIRVTGRTAIVNGVPRLSGAPVMASDLRASASLVLAGLAAEGVTEVLRIYHLDRGYESIEEKLNAVGARITREKI